MEAGHCPPRKSEPTLRDRSTERGVTRPGAPFPSSDDLFGTGRDLSRARGFCAATRTLDRSLPVHTIRSEGKGTGGFRRSAPWRSMRQRLMRAPRAAPPVRSQFLCRAGPNRQPSQTSGASRRFPPTAYRVSGLVQWPSLVNIILSKYLKIYLS